MGNEQASKSDFQRLAAISTNIVVRLLFAFLIAECRLLNLRIFPVVPIDTKGMGWLRRSSRLCGLLRDKCRLGAEKKAWFAVNCRHYDVMGLIYRQI